MDVHNFEETLYRLNQLKLSSPNETMAEGLSSWLRSNVENLPGENDHNDWHLISRRLVNEILFREGIVHKHAYIPQFVLDVEIVTCSDYKSILNDFDVRVSFLRLNHQENECYIRYIRNQEDASFVVCIPITRDVILDFYLQNDVHVARRENFYTRIQEQFNILQVTRRQYEPDSEPDSRPASPVHMINPEERARLPQWLCELRNCEFIGEEEQQLPTQR